MTNRHPEGLLIRGWWCVCDIFNGSEKVELQECRSCYRGRPKEIRHRRVILESPYAGDVARNELYARRALRDSLLRGEAPLASHLLYTQPGVLDDKDTYERSLGIAAGLVWLPAARASVIYTDYGLTRGMEEGIQRAHQAGVPVEYRDIGINA